LNKLAKYDPCGAVTPSTAKLLLFLLRDITDDHDSVIISQRRIAESLGVTRQTVSINLRRLEQAGEITIEPLYSEYGGRFPNKYRLRRNHR